MPVLEAPSWTADVERGPNWLFLRVHAPEKSAASCEDLADVVWQTMEQHFANRVVLELDNLKMLNSRLIGQLVLLQKRICTKGGTLRVCGLSDASQAALHSTRLDSQFPCYRDRTDAVMGTRPGRPR
jgi:anti-sigma B factor antagonist